MFALIPGLFSAEGPFAPHILLWEAFVSLAILGLGLVTLRLLSLRDRHLPLAAATGVALWLFVGGWLNLTHMASKPVLRAGLSLGFLMALFELTRPSFRQHIAASIARLRASRGTLMLGVLIGTYLILIFALRLRPTLWNTFDDPRGYMAFTSKASALNGLQPEPFSERQVVNGFGGSIFLGATMLAGADLSAMGYLEKAFGYLLYAALIWSLLIELGLSPRQATALLYLLPLLPLLDANLTSAYLAASIILAIFLILVRVEREQTLAPNVALLIGLLLAAACALKTTGLLFGGLLATLCALQFLLRQRSVQSLPAWLLAGFSCLVVLLPWVLLLRRNEGTPLFPVFGAGDHISAYGLLPAPSHLTAKSAALLIGWSNTLCVLTGGAAVFALSWRTSFAVMRLVLAFFVAALVATVSICLSTSGEGVDRYTMFFSVPALVLLAACLVVSWQALGVRSMLRPAVTAPLIVCLVCALLVHANPLYFDDGLRLNALRGDYHKLRVFDTVLSPATLQVQADILQRAQQTVPPGQAVLATIRDAYGFDWRRNTVYIADYPGMASPAPGMPTLGSSEDLRRYLLRSSIHYIAYDPTALRSKDGFADFTAHPQLDINTLRLFQRPRSHLYFAAWSRMESAVSLHTLAQMQELTTRRSLLYESSSLRIVALDVH